MKILLKNELKRAFKNKWFYITIAIGIMIVMYDMCVERIPIRQAMDVYINTDNYTIPNLYNSWMELSRGTARNLLHYIYPLLVCIPYAITMYTDVKTKYMYNIIIRIDKKKYFISKLIVQFLVGFAVVIIIMTASFVLTAAILPAGVPFFGLNYTVGGRCVLSVAFYTNPLAISLLVIILDSIIFATIGCISYVFAYILDNGIMVIVSAFTLYFFEMVVSPLIGNNESMFLCTYLFNITRAEVLRLLIEIVIIIIMSLLAYFIRSRKKDEL